MLASAALSLVFSFLSSAQANSCPEISGLYHACTGETAKEVKIEKNSQNGLVIYQISLQLPDGISHTETLPMSGKSEPITVIDSDGKPRAGHQINSCQNQVLISNLYLYDGEGAERELVHVSETTLSAPTVNTLKMTGKEMIMGSTWSSLCQRVP